MRGLPPGPGGPGVWQVSRMTRDPLGFADACRDRYGDVFTLRFGPGGALVMISEPDLVREVLTTHAAALPAGRANATIEPLVGRSVLLLDDEPHLRRRRLLLPPLHGERVQRYREVMREVTAEEVATWAPGDVVMVRDRMQRITLEVIMRVVFGVRDEARRRAFREVLTHFVASAASTAIFVPALRRNLGPRSPWGGFLRHRRALDALILDEIAERRRAPDAEARDDILSLLLSARTEEDVPLTDRELRDELLTMLVAGHETTATGLSWAVELLLRRPDALARLDEDEWIEAVIRETLRMRPPIFDAVRSVRQPVELGGHRIPRGVGVGLFALGLHRRADLFPEPHAFRPERFLGTRPGTYTWLPFGGGVRRCLGAAFAQVEMREVLREVFARVRLSPVHPTPEPARLQVIAVVPARRVPVRVDGPATR